MSYFRLVHVALALATAAIFSTRALAVEPVPRYRFTVGEQLIYEMTTEYLAAPRKPAESTDKPQDRVSFTVTPIRKNADGSWRILVRTQVTLWSNSNKEKPEVRFKNDFLAYCDLAPDGDFKMNPTIGSVMWFKLAPDWIFPSLPSSGNEWTQTSKTTDATYNLAAKAVDANKLLITGSITYADSAVYEVDTTLNIDFDLANGRMTQFIREITSKNSASPYHKRTTIKLISSSQLSANDVERLAQDSEGYFQVAATSWQAHKAADHTRTVAACKKSLETVRALILTKQDEAKDPTSRELYRALLKLYDRESQLAVEAAERREQVYAQPPVSWVTADLDGQMRRREDYAGRVVVLDFWYRGCSHCIRALPKIKKIHETYRDRGVAVIGVNNDGDISDARHVIKTCSITHETIRNSHVPVTAGQIEKAAEPLPKVKGEGRALSEIYRVVGWPTTVVLDQTGRVASVHGGNADDLSEQIGKVIDDLLANPPRKSESDTATSAADHKS